MSRISPKMKVTLIVAGTLVIGVLIGSTVFASLLSQNAAGTERQSLMISGTETIKVLGPGGDVISTWQGPDPITANTINALAGCITGINAGGSPAGVFGSCESWIGGIALWTDSPAGTCTVPNTATKVCTYVNPIPATNTLTPVGCTTGSTSSYGTCTGWITEATFGPTTFTSSNCGTSCVVQEVIGVAPNNYPFDTLCASTFAPGEPSAGCMSGSIATVAPQDSLLVTIQFTAS